ncbi:FAD binding domain-containing protein [Dichotomopilus funicola]|uniref:FAD binding domain-containing protein n=1 Tax=Dichotomopilus funicola TaxID=1934379 RepID=A0AAN6ZTB9_9PEZI|nr:FAD binding domain-containing protein [Dichotomopilus funicola]
MGIFTAPLVTLAVAAAFYATGIEAKCGPWPEVSCCRKLVAAGLGHSVVFPNETTYHMSLESYWSTSAALSPWCMVFPSTAEDVSTIITTVVAGHCPFGVKGAAKKEEKSGFANSISSRTGNMNETTYNSKTGIASIQPGAHWQSVYETLAPHGVVATGGRAGSVGVGGFLTGGGNSFHSASHGLGCDNVVNFEVVIADGSIINANAEQNPDLWVALKGGSGNLGLVTRFDLSTIKYPNPAKPEIWGKFISYDPSAGGGVIDAMVDFTDKAHLDQNTTSILYFGHVPAAGGKVIHLGLENTIGVADPPAVAGYRKAGKILTENGMVVPMTELVKSEGPAQPAGHRNIWFSLAFNNDARVMKFATEQHEIAVTKLTKLLPGDDGNGNFTTMCAFQPLNRVIADHGIQRGGNVMGLDYWIQKSGSHGVLFLAELGLHGAENEKKAYPIVRAWAAAVEAYARDLGVGWGWQYLNYAGAEQDPLATIGPHALGKLRAAANKYDPDRVFQRLRASGFKIPEYERL